MFCFEFVDVFDLQNCLSLLVFFKLAMRMVFLLLYQDKRRRNKKKKSRLRLRAYSGKAVLVLKKELASLHYAQTAFFSTARPFLRSRPYA